MHDVLCGGGNLTFPDAIGLPNTLQTCIVCYAVKLALDMELHKDTNLNKPVSEGRY